MSKNSTKVVLDLCGGTGAWSRPYKEAGYDVRVVTLPEQDVCTYRLPDEPIYGILAAPPCTMFSLARTRAKTPRNFEEGLRPVRACLDLIWTARLRGPLAFWAMENPKAYLRQFLGKAPFEFDPWEFGDPYTKRTELWGYYNLPKKRFSEISQVMTDHQRYLCSRGSSGMTKIIPSITDITGSNDKELRAVTPQGFANAFFKANR